MRWIYKTHPSWYKHICMKVMFSFNVWVLYKDIRQKPQAPGDHHPENRSHETCGGNQRPNRHSRQLPTETNHTNGTALLGHFQYWEQQLVF